MMKKRGITLLLAIMLTVSILFAAPGTTGGAKADGIGTDVLFVGGTDIVRNGGSVEGTGGGTAKIPTGSEIANLELDSYQYSGEGHSFQSEHYSILCTGSYTLCVILIGNSEVINTSTANGYGIGNIGAGVNISGNYSLKASGSAAGISAVSVTIQNCGELTATGETGISSKSSLSIRDSTVNATGENGIVTNTKLSIRDSTVTATGGEGKKAILAKDVKLDHVYISEPAEGKFVKDSDSSYFYVAAPDGTAAEGVKIEPFPAGKNRLVFDGNGGSGYMKSTWVAVDDNYIFPECTFTAPAGKRFDHWEMSGVDGMLHPENPQRIADNCISDDGVVTVTAYWITADPASVTKEPQGLKTTYNGQKQELVTAGEAENGTMQYAIGKDNVTTPVSGWSGNIPEEQNPGTYYIWYKAKGDSTHSDSGAAYCTAEIEKAPVTVTISAADRDYEAGNKTVALTAGTVNGAAAGDNVTVDLSAAQGEMADDGAGEGKTVTVTGAALGGTGAGNYILSGQPAGVTVNIRRIPDPGVIADTASVTVGGNTVDLGVNVTGAVGSVSWAVDGDANGCTLDGKGVLTSGDTAGSCRVQATIADSANHTGRTGTITVTVTDKATAQMDVAQADAVYGETPADPVYTRPAGAMGEAVIRYSGTTAAGAAYGPDSRKPTEAGSYTVSVTEETSDTIHTGSAGFVISKAEVTITAQNHALTYNGTAQAWTEYDVEGLKGDDAVTAVVTGSITCPGESPVVNKLESYTFTKGKATNYSVTTANGALTMKNAEAPITIIAGDGEWTYDGTAHTNPAVAVTEGKLFDGDELVATAAGSVVHAADTKEGNNPVKADYKILHGDEDVTANYVITAVAGTLTVNRKDLTITADSDTKTYDGTPLAKGTWTNTALATGDVLQSVSITAARTAAGTTANVPSAAKIVNAAGEDVTGDYDITYTNGTLEVTKKSLIITADSDTKTYDGTALTKNSYTNTALAEGDVIESVTMAGSQTEVGSSENVPSAAKIVNASGEDVTASYQIEYKAGTLQVTQNQAVIITADSDTKTYDGTPLTKNSWKVTGLAEGDSLASVTVTGSRTAAGSSANVPSAAKIVNAAGEDVTGDYDITYTEGTLSVTPRSAIITADSDIKTYDGTALTKGTWTNTDLAKGDRIAGVTMTGSQTEIGTSDNVPSAAKIVNEAGEDVTESYEITYQKGTLKVTQKLVVFITADSDSKTYDGTPLTKGTWQATGLAAGDSVASVKMTGSRTEAGKSDNVPSDAKIVNAAGEDVTAKYEITYQNGTLAVTPKAVTITAEAKSKVYGETDPELTATVSGAVGDEKLNYTLARAKGEDAGEYAITVTVGENPNYEVTAAGSILTIAKADSAVSTAPTAKTGLVEDGTAQELVTAGTADGGEMQYVAGMDDRTALTEDWSNKVPTGTDAGTYYVWYKVAGDANHNDTEAACVKAEIEKAPEPEPEPEPVDLIEQFVARCYLLILDREPEAGGLAYWTKQLKTGESSVSEMLQSFVSSKEFRERNFSDKETLEILLNAMDANETDRAKWTAELEKGTPLLTIINGLGASNEFTQVREDHDIDSDYGNEYGKRININKVRAMVARCYKVFLGREAEDAGMNYWAELLSSGKRTAVNTILGFLTSKEYTALKKSNGEIVEALYQTMLNRAAEAEGKAAWTAMLDKGEPVEKVINGIAESNEFKAICKNLGIRAGKLWVAGEEQPAGDEGENPEQKDPEDKAPEEKWDEDKIQAFVARCYRKGLGRDPETEGLENWTNLIVRGKSTPVKAVKAILTSEEAKKLNLSDEAFVNALYGIFLNRSADETGMAGWVDKLESGTTRESLISSFAKTEEVQKAMEKMKKKE